MIKIHKRPFFSLSGSFVIDITISTVFLLCQGAHYQVIGTTGYGRSKGVTLVGDKQVFIEKTTLNF